MPESDTTVLRRAREGAAKHANAAFNGLSGAAIVWLFVTFASKDDVNRHIDQSNLERSKVWQKVMDQELEIDRLKRRFGMIEHTNTTAAFWPQKGRE